MTAAYATILKTMSSGAVNPHTQVTRITDIEFCCRPTCFGVKFHFIWLCFSNPTKKLEFAQWL
jgi:hypothetical protein